MWAKVTMQWSYEGQMEWKNVITVSDQGKVKELGSRKSMYTSGCISPYISLTLDAWATEDTLVKWRGSKGKEFGFTINHIFRPWFNIKPFYVFGFILSTSSCLPTSTCYLRGCDETLVCIKWPCQFRWPFVCWYELIWTVARPCLARPKVLCQIESESWRPGECAWKILR